MENKKVLNTVARVYKGLNFKSTLEMDTYKALEREGLNPEYERYRFILQDTKAFKVPIFMPYKDRKQHKDVWGQYPYKILSIKYTPDFVLKYNGTTFIIECKGYPNDRYSYQMRLFMNFLEEKMPDSVFLEVHNKRQLEKAIEIIKQWKENH